MHSVLITGGAGFLGSHLSRAFLDRGVSVRIFDLEARPDWTLGLPLEYIQGDIRDASALGAAVQGVDAIVHSAFASPRLPLPAIHSTNVEGARQLCEQAVRHKVRRAVFISSTIVERPPARKWAVGAPARAMEMYRASRKEAEEVAAAYRSKGLSLAMVRPKTFIGPGRVSAFTIVFDWIYRGRPVTLLGSAECRYQLLEIRDMAEGIRLLTGSDAEGVFYFGAREYGRLRDDLAALIQHAGTGSRLRFIPGAIARPAILLGEAAGLPPLSELHHNSAWNRDSMVDTSRAVNELGWRPRWSNVEALQNAWDWYAGSMRTTGSARTIHALPESHRRIRRWIEMLLP